MFGPSCSPVWSMLLAERVAQIMIFKIQSVHKWIGVISGCFLLVWLVSGIVMVLPGFVPESSGQPKERLLLLDGSEISPSEAIAVLTKSLGRSANVISVALMPIREVVAYRITMRDGNSALVDARAKRLFQVTPDLAESIVRDNFPTRALVHRTELIQHHDLNYPWGSLPAYRVVFGDNLSTRYHLSIKDGAVQASNWWTRIQTATGRLHTFQPLKLVLEKDELREAFLILFSLLGIGVAATGYYLAIWGWLR